MSWNKLFNILRIVEEAKAAAEEAKAAQDAREAQEAREKAAEGLFLLEISFT